MLKIVRITGAVHTHTHGNIFSEEKIVYKVYFNNSVYKTDQLI